VARVPTRDNVRCRRVSTTSGEKLPAGSLRTGRRGLTQQIPAGNGQDGPAMRPKHPPAAESGVGEHTARESESAQACAEGEERVANAHSHQLAPEASKLPEPFAFYTRQSAHQPLLVHRSLPQIMLPLRLSLLLALSLMLAASASAAKPAPQQVHHLQVAARGERRASARHLHRGRPGHQAG